MTYEKPELYELGRAATLVLGVIAGSRDSLPPNTEPSDDLVLGLDD